MADTFITAICGDEGCGKTTMGLTFPTPVYHMDIDVGSFDRASWRMELDGVTSESFPRPIQLDRMMGNVSKRTGDNVTDIRVAKKVEGMLELWQSIVRAFAGALNDPKIKTIIVDSATLLWNIAHQSHLQELQEKQLVQGTKTDDPKFRERLTSMEYGPANDRMRQLFHSARGVKKNLVLVHYPRDQYRDVQDPKTGEVKSITTGEKEMDGFKETSKHADVVLWVKIKETKTLVGKDTKITRTPFATIVNKCGIPGMGMNALGMTFPATYQGLVNLRNVMRMSAMVEEDESD